MLKPYPIYDRNGQHRYLIYDQNGLKNPTPLAAHTYTAHIREYPPRDANEAPKHSALTLNTALDISRTEEVTSNQIKEISPGTSTHVDELVPRPHHPFVWMLLHRARYF